MQKGRRVECATIMYGRHRLVRLVVFKDAHTTSVEFRDVCQCCLQSRVKIAE